MKQTEKTVITGTREELPKIKFKDWNEVFKLQYSLISVCQSSILLLGENRCPQFNEVEHEKVFGSDGYTISEVLRFTKELTPFWSDIDVIKVKS